MGPFLPASGFKLPLRPMLDSPLLFCCPIPLVPDLQKWLPADRLTAPLASDLHDWLYEDKGSLTRRLTALANGAFSVTPLFEGWQAMREDECTALGVAAGSHGWVREVFLSGHEQPWVFARSVAAQQALEQSELDLPHLGSRSLGELLFSDPAFQRSQLEARHYPIEWLPEAVRRPGLWARRSCFSRGDLRVLVAEVFLPELWQAARIIT